MARSMKKNRRRDWRKIMFWVITLLVALSMILGSIMLSIPSISGIK